MYIIDKIVMIWAISVGIIVVFMICDRIVWNRPKTKFAKWWRNNVVMHPDRNNK